MQGPGPCCCLLQEAAVTCSGLFLGVFCGNQGVHSRCPRGLGCSADLCYDKCHSESWLLQGRPQEKLSAVALQGQVCACVLHVLHGSFCTGEGLHTMPFLKQEGNTLPPFCLGKATLSLHVAWKPALNASWKHFLLSVFF